MEHSGTTEAPPREDAAQAGRPALADGARMSPAIGPVSVLPASGQQSPYGDDVAPATRELVDTETRRIIEECYEQALAELRGSRDRLDRLALTLLERETLEEDEAYAAAGLTPGAAAPALTGAGAE